MSQFSKNPFRIMQFNVENLFVFMDHYAGEDLTSLDESAWQRLSTSSVANKPLTQVIDISAAIRDAQPDLVMLCEVGGRESLENFSRFFLNGVYKPFLIEGNSDRGIDLGFLVKADLPFRYDLISHRNRSLDFLYPHERQSELTGYPVAHAPSHRFSRDVLELRIFEQNDEPVLIVLLVHLKSQIDRDNIDPGGRDRRRAELEKLVEICGEVEAHFNHRVPIVLGGDFNGRAARENTDSEFRALHERTSLIDAFDAAQIAPENRFTFLQVSSHRPAIERQLDYIFVSPVLVPRVNARETYAYRFKDHLGQELGTPRNLNAKRLLPSDHYPVILSLNGSP